MRPLLTFFLLGTALFCVKRSMTAAGAAPVPLRVHLAAGASGAQREQAVEQALLAEFGRRYGAPLRDPVIRERLLSSLCEGEAAPDDRELLRQADELDLWHEDAMIEARLKAVAELRLTAAFADYSASDAELNAYREAHAERYQRPERVSFVHVFLARDKHAAALTPHARALRGLFARERIGPEQAGLHSEPSNLPTRVSDASLSQVRRRFGEEFAEALSTLSPGAWSEPVPSAFGLHLVWITERKAGGPLTLAEARRRLSDDYREERMRQALARQVAALRSAYAVEIVP